MIICWTVVAAVCGFIIDLIVGDPRWIYHPVCIIGNAISAVEKIVRKIFGNTKKGERIAGTILVIVITVSSAAVPAVILLLLYRLCFIAGFAVEVFFCWQLLATKSLEKESGKVYRELKKGTLESARHAVSMIVGRDTQNLDQEGITKAAVETVAENTSDGVIAPLFYMMIGGPVWAFVYKAINTMDSMIGYKNDKYKYFGTAAARLDDVANFIPARISALLMIAAAYMCGADGAHAMKIWRRDRRKHASPNSAQTESVMAGALDIRLAGNAWYFGQLHEKPYIGDPKRPVEPEDIKRSHQLMYMTAILSVIIFGIIRWSVFITSGI